MKPTAAIHKACAVVRDLIVLHDKPENTGSRAKIQAILDDAKQLLCHLIGLPGQPPELSDTPLRSEIKHVLFGTSEALHQQLLHTLGPDTK